jgi:fumarate reductase flavoprotein subunit
MRIKNVNVAIFGSGLAGLTAAVTLLEKGVKGVAVFEKRPFQGGAISNTPMCTMAVRNDRKYQDKAFKEHCRFTSFDANMETARAWIVNSWRIPGFIKSLGLDFEMEVETLLEEIGNNDAYTGGFPFGMNLGDYYILKARGKGHGAALICLRAAQKIRKLGGELIFNTALQELLTDEHGVTGAIVKEKSGETYHVNANDVIIATGGLGNAAKEMIKEETGYINTDRELAGGGNHYCNSFVNDQMTGDGLKAAWKIGAEKTKIMGSGRHIAYPGVVNYVPWIVKNQISTIMEQPYLIVNSYGERFIDEGENRRSANMAAAMRNQPGRIAYLIFDEDTMKHLETEGTEYFYMIFPATIIENGKEQFREMIEKYGSKQVFMEDSLEALAKKAGIDKTGLLKTVDRYNQLCDNGYDEDFGKESKYLRPVKNASFYCIRLCNCTYSMIGGINVNKKGQVLDKTHRPIEHLYAAGDCAAGCIYGSSTPNVTSVSSISYTQGMICADSIAFEQERSAGK